MDIPINAAVTCSDHVCGHSTAVILDPITQKITHIVVKDQRFPNVERLVPVTQIEDSTPNSIQLNCSKEKLEKTDEFNEHEFIRAEKPYTQYSSNQYFLWPYVHPVDHTYIDIKHKRIPLGELAIHRGAQVQALDVHVGSVDEFLVDPINCHITHIVLREGHLWGKKDVSIPVGMVDHILDNTVYLKLDKVSIEALPAIPIKRWT